MRARPIILYWLLLLVPTLIVGALALALLGHEKDRLRRAARDAVESRAVTVVESMQLAMRETEAGLIHSLRDVPDAQLGETLTGWQASNPLVRNGFAWQPDGGIAHPDPNDPATREEAGFLARYEGLFSGRLTWENLAPRTSERQQTQVGQRQAITQSSSIAPRKRSPRQQLWELSNVKAPVRPDDVYAQPAVVPVASAALGGCIPWFFENRLYLLVWTRASPGGAVRGVEIETMALLSRLLGALPQQPPPGQVYALIDDAGQIIHRTGAPALPKAARPVVSVPLGACLPHWSVAVYAPQGLASAATGSLLVVSSLLVAVFVVAILAGGSMLLWQAQRNMLDARSKTTFVSNVSHELKTPLTSIRMYAELLSEGRVSDPTKRTRYLDVIVAESQRLTRLVNNVLDFGRLEQGRKTYRPEPLPLVNIVDTVLSNQALRLHQAGLSLNRQIAVPDGLTVNMDRDALEQVILNLLDNAAKYAAKGAEVTVGVTAEGDTAMVDVMDRGPGVPGAHCQRIFDKFHRIDDSLTANQPGSGLGLSIARRMMRDLGGNLTYRPRDGGGACFSITLPLARK